MLYYKTSVNTEVNPLRSEAFHATHIFVRWFKLSNGVACMFLGQNLAKTHIYVSSDLRGFSPRTSLNASQLEHIVSSSLIWNQYITQTSHILLKKKF